MSNITLQDEVERYVKSHKMLKKDFAAKIGITPVQLSHWLKGRISFNRKTIEKVIAVLDGH